MKFGKNLPTALVLTVGMSSGSAALATTANTFHATLTGDQEVAPNLSPFTATASFTLLGAGTASPSLVFDMLFDPGLNFGLTGSTGTQQVTGLHIHHAPRGQNGAVVFGFLSPVSDLDLDTTFEVRSDGSTRITGEWDANEGVLGATFADFAAIFANAAAGEDVPFYVNLHTAANPAGEIRGQIVAAAVPLPATLPMLAGGILILAFRRRRHGA